MDAAAMDCARYRTGSIVANVRPDGPVEIAAYGSKWNVMITLTMTKVKQKVRVKIRVKSRCFRIIVD